MTARYDQSGPDFLPLRPVAGAEVGIKVAPGGDHQGALFAVQELGNPPSLAMTAQSSFAPTRPR